MPARNEPLYSVDDLVVATGTPATLLMNLALRVPGGPRPGVSTSEDSLTLRVALAVAAAAHFKQRGASPKVVNEVLRVVLLERGFPRGTVVRRGRAKPVLERLGVEMDFATAARRMPIPQLFELDPVAERLDEEWERRCGRPVPDPTKY